MAIPMFAWSNPVMKSTILVAARGRWWAMTATIIVIGASTSIGKADQVIVPLQILPPQSTATTYNMVADIQGPRGKVHGTEQVQLLARDTTGFEATLAVAGAPSQTFQLNEQRGLLVLRDGSIPSDAKASSKDGDNPAKRAVFQTVLILNLLTTPLVTAPTPILQGATWEATALVAVPGGDALAIPLMVTARTVIGQAVGARSWNRDLSRARNGSESRHRLETRRIVS
jgi:hypothetical protein